MKTITLNRVGPALKPDPSRVLIRPFQPGDEAGSRRLVARVLALSEPTVTQLLSEVLGEFGDRHAELEEFLHRRFGEVSHFLPPEAAPSALRATSPPTTPSTRWSRRRSTRSAASTSS